MNRNSKTVNLSPGDRGTILRDSMHVGFIQVTLPDTAWPEDTKPLRMSRINADHVWQQVEKGFRNLHDHSKKPDIVVLPELTIPQGYKGALKNLAQAIRAVVIAGMDFEIVPNGMIRNKAIVVIPQRWPDIDYKPKSCKTEFFGKCFFSKDELEVFKKFGYSPLPDPVMQIFHAGRFGRIGVAICSDFFDIERFVVYRGHIHHMIVISHNKDTNSYQFLAEAISRLVFCNVVICNTGTYGDSFAFCPFEKNYKRFVYRHQGLDLFTTQVVELPVLSLDNAQRGIDRGIDNRNVFKARPPGYPERTSRT